MRLVFGSLWLGIFFLCPAFAQDGYKINPEDPIQTQWAIQDNPETATLWIDREIDTLDRARDEVLWAKWQAIYALAAAEYWDKSFFSKRSAAFKDARKILQKTKFQRHWLALEFMAVDDLTDSPSIVATYKTLIANADRLHEREFQTLFLYKLAYNQTQSDPEQALAALQEAHKIMQNTPGFDPLYAALLQSHSALAFNSLNQPEQATRLLDEVLAFSKRNPLRFMMGLMNYNYGAFHFNLNTSEGNRIAAAAYHRSTEAAASIGDQSTEATSLLGLANLANRAEKFQEALAPTAKAAEIFLKLKDYEWVCEAHKRHAAALNGLHRFAEALDSLQLAEKYLPDDSMRDQMEIAKMRATAFAGQKDFARAFAAQQRFSDLNAEISKKKIEMNYAKQLADLGLEVETQRNALLKEENQRQAEALVHSSRQRFLVIVLLCFALLILGVAAFALVKAREVKRSQTKMERILNHIDEGILTMGQDLRIEPEYSRHLQDILDRKEDLRGLDALHLLLGPTALNEEQRSMVRASLQACLGEDAITWDMNEGHLPNELHFVGSHARVLTANWTPILNQQKIRQVLLCLRDVTSRRQLEQDFEKARRRNESLQIKVSELIDAELSQTVRILQEGERLLQQLPEGLKQNHIKILRELHTLKGGARTLGLRSLSSVLHDLESACRENLKEPILAVVESALQHLAEYQHLVFKVFHFGQQHESHVRYRCLADTLRTLIPDLAQRAQAKGLAYKTFHIRDGLVAWPESLLHILQPIFLHVCNNCLDHGFILPRARGEKIRAIEIEVEAEQSAEQIQIRILDNGMGLNFQRLRLWAQSKGQTIQEESLLIDMLFQDGLSTAENTTESSGRGVGLAAVRSLVEQNRGRISMNNRSDCQGTEMKILFPVQNKVLSGDLSVHGRA